jgi:hypothetical protein
MGILVGDSAQEQSTSQGLPPKINSVKVRALVLLGKIIIWCFCDLGLGLEAILDLTKVFFRV